MLFALGVDLHTLLMAIQHYYVSVLNPLNPQLTKGINTKAALQKQAMQQVIAQ